jgi:serine phosphatase RsbU (regulator of sigma subunit)
MKGSTTQPACHALARVPGHGTPYAAPTLVNFSTEPSYCGLSAGVPRELGGFRIVADSRAAGARSGGDFWIATAREQGRLAVVIGDACGHGRVGAEQLHHLLPAVRELARFGAGPGWLLWELNRRLEGRLPVDRFVTAAALEIDLRAGRILVANAGHVPALVRQAEHGVQVIGRASGPPLGMQHQAEYREERCAFRAGDVLVCMTDGVFEAVESDLMSMHTLRHVLAGAGQGSCAVQRAVLGCLGPVLAGNDDMTLVSLEARAAVVPSVRYYKQVA